MFFLMRHLAFGLRKASQIAASFHEHGVFELTHSVGHFNYHPLKVSPETRPGRMWAQARPFWNPPTIYFSPSLMRRLPPLTTSGGSKNSTRIHGPFLKSFERTGSRLCRFIILMFSADARISVETSTRNTNPAQRVWYVSRVLGSLRTTQTSTKYTSIRWTLTACDVHSKTQDLLIPPVIIPFWSLRQPL